MPTNDERREMAAKLRERTKKPMGKSMQRMFTETLGMYQHNICWMNPDKATARWDTIVNRLAELIEPEERTCHAGVFSDGAGAWVICCTECGYDLGGKWSSLDIARRMARGQHKCTRFCPNCGAKVDGE